MEYEGKEFAGLQMDGEVISDKQFIGCHFERCKFYELRVEKCSFTECTFTDCTVLGTRFKYTMGRNNGFVRCTLVGVDWRTIMMSGKSAALPFNQFSACTLKYNNFYHMRLKRFNFSDCDLTGSFFEGCDLSEGKFSDAELNETVFTDNDLRGADFRRARNYFFSVENNRLKKAKFSFPEAINLLTATGILVE